MPTKRLEEHRDKKRKKGKEFDEQLRTQEGKKERRRDMKSPISVSRFFNFLFLTFSSATLSFPQHDVIGQCITFLLFCFYNFLWVLCLCLCLSPSSLSISYSSIYYCMLWNQYQKKQHIPINTKHIFLTQIASKHPTTTSSSPSLLVFPKCFSPSFATLFCFSSINFKSETFLHVNSILFFDSLAGFLWVFHLLPYFCFFFDFRMGPIRGFKRKKKVEKKVDQNVFASASLSSQLQPLDWWDEFSQRITGKLVFLPVNFTLSCSFVQFVHCHCSYWASRLNSRVSWGFWTGVECSVQ